MMSDLDKDTVDFRPTFDETSQEPTVLPTPFPNLLINGSTGIAVGMATSIPPHNMREVIDGVIGVIERRSEPAEDRFRFLLQTIPGPDFPSGGTIVGREGIYKAYKDGRGGITVRGKATFEEHKKTDPCLDRHHRDSLSGQQEEPDRGHRGAGQREAPRRDLRHSRRVEPRGHADRHRSQARRAARRHPQQPLQAHQAADGLRHHAAGHRRQPAARPEPAADHRALHRLPS
jgi:hypothetical protein